MQSGSDARRIYPRLAPIHALESDARRIYPRLARYAQSKLDVRPIYLRVARCPQSNSDVRPMLSNVVVALYGVIPPTARIGGHGVTQGNHRCTDPISLTRNGARRGRIRALRRTTNSARGWASSTTRTNPARGLAS